MILFPLKSAVRKNRAAVWLLLGIVLLGTTTGCVRRRMTVRSNPPGATVYLDNKEIGKTPLTTGFDYYGYREFRCVKDQYETKTVTLPVRAPWYQWIGLDFFSEVLLPGRLVDHKEYMIEMTPQRVVPQQELITRAEETRRLTHAGHSSRLVDPILSPQPVGGAIAPVEPLLPQPPNVTPYPQPGLSPSSQPQYPPAQTAPPMVTPYTTPPALSQPTASPPPMAPSNPFAPIQP